MDTVNEAKERTDRMFERLGNPADYFWVTEKDGTGHYTWVMRAKGYVCLKLAPSIGVPYHWWTIRPYDSPTDIVMSDIEHKSTEAALKDCLTTLTKLPTL